jgi:hypothetical protein
MGLHVLRNRIHRDISLVEMRMSPRGRLPYLLGEIATSPWGYELSTIALRRDRKIVLFYETKGSNDFSISLGRHRRWGSILLGEPMESNFPQGINIPGETLHFLNSSIRCCYDGKYFNKIPQTSSKNPMVKQRKW